MLSGIGWLCAMDAPQARRIRLLGAIPEWIVERWQVLKSVVARPWFTAAAVVWGGIGAYDLVGAQLHPEWIANKLPTVHPEADGLSCTRFTEADIGHNAVDDDKTAADHFR